MIPIPLPDSFKIDKNLGIRSLEIFYGKIQMLYCSM